MAHGKFTLPASLTLTLGTHSVATMELGDIELNTNLDTSSPDRVAITIENAAIVDALTTAVRKATNRIEQDRE